MINVGTDSSPIWIVVSQIEAVVSQARGCRVRCISGTFYTTDLTARQVVRKIEEYHAR